MTTTHLTPKEKQQRYRSRLNRRGLRPVQIWVPDTRSAGFAAECERQARLVGKGRDEAAVMAFIDDIADWGDK